MTGARAVISDFGGVLTSSLLDSYKGIQDSSGITMQVLGDAMAAIAIRDGRHPRFELEKGRLTERRFLELLGEAVRDHRRHPVDLSGFVDAFWNGIRVNVAMIEELRFVRHRGFRLALLTNNVREWEPRWRAMLPVDELFDVVVDSAAVGMRKPDPGIYRLTLDALGMRPPECVFIDDLEINCRAAAQLGLRTVWFRETERAIAELEATLSCPP